MQFYFTIILFSLFGIACQSSRNEEQKQVLTTTNAPTQSLNYSPIETGKLVNPVICAADSMQRYAAYLPSNYDTAKKYPLLICFDAHAGGRIPVENYMQWAEKYGYVLVGSNNSKNGLDAASIQSIAAIYKNDVLHRFSIDPHRIYVAGFSGGARVAAQLALQGEAQGLVACSAGFPMQTNMNFSFLGFAGTEDFNSNEMIALNRNLDAAALPHQLILFEGKHEWPSKEVFEEAFLWLDFDAMRKKIIPLNQPEIETYLAKQNKKVERLKSAGKIMEHYRELDKTANFLFGLTNTDALLQARTQLEKLPELRNGFNQEAQIQKQEMELQNYYRQAMQQQQASWWLTEIDNLKLQVNSKANNSAEKSMIKRTLSFLSLLTYMTVSAAIKQEQFTQANDYLKIYEKVDPDNTEVYYLQAQMAVQLGQASAVSALLQKAIDKGFKDSTRLKTDSYFESFKNGAQWQSWLHQMAKTE